MRLIWLDGTDGGPVAVDADRVAALEVVLKRDRAKMIAKDANGSAESVGTKILLTGLMAPVMVTNDAPEVAKLLEGPGAEE